MVRFMTFLMLTTISFAAFSTEVNRPQDMQFTAPTVDVPVNCAEFFSPTGWGRARWDSGRTGELWIENVSPDCTAQVVYVFGPIGQRPGGYLRVTDAEIERQMLRFVLDLEYQGRRVVADVRYEMAKAHSDGRPILIGTWAERGGSRASIVLEKGAH